MILAHSPRTMVSKLVACLLIIPAAVIWAAGPHAAVHPAPYAPVHPAPYAPAHPAPYAPAHHGYCDPKAPPKCAEGSDLPYCIVDKEYPAYDIAKPQEESFDYKYYTGASKGPSPYDASHWIGPEGYLCPSDVDYAKITRAVNVEGYWRIILQHIPEGYGYGHYNYTQTTRLETCLFPDSACRLLAPCYQSKCTQKYVYHRMLSVDPCDPYRGFFIDTYKLPSACSCHLPA